MIDVGSVEFIDFHVHPPTAKMLGETFGPFTPALEKVFGRAFEVMETDELADYYRSLGGAAVLLAWDAETITGLPALTNADVAAMVDRHPDVFVGFGSVDPHKGAAAVMGVHEAAHLGLRGLKFHPSAQCFSPADHAHFPIFEAAEQLGLVVLSHTGVTALGRGLPGGGGIRHRYAHPLLLDELAAEFPGLQIVAAHPSHPWQAEAVSIAEHKPNLHLELSGWSPKYLEDGLVRAMQRTLSDRVVFGTDFPFLTVEKWRKDWETLMLPDDLTVAILKDNAARLLGLG